jgi:hypothetical protein
MVLLALAPETSDLLTIWGFIVGVVSLVLGVIAFVIAIVQLKQARDAALASKDAAEAARDAAQETLAESKEAYERFVGAFASRLLSELDRSVSEREWSLAKLRSDDLSELLATLPSTRNEEYDAGTGEAVKSLRAFASTFARMGVSKAKELSKPNVKKWELLVLLLHTRLDHLRRPFREKPNGQVGANGPSPEVPPIRSGSGDEDKGTPS